MRYPELPATIVWTAAVILALALLISVGHAQTQATLNSSVTFQSNDLHAVYGTPVAERSLLSGGQTVVQGEQPLAQYGTLRFAPYSSVPEVPLGDVARYYRRKKEEHVQAH